MAGREPEESVRRPASAQQWRKLTFLHWRYDPAVIRPLVPEELEVDTCDGSAWVSVTPFLMVDFRIGRLPAPFRGLSTFPETNVRTYARGRDGRDGLWFLSLEAGSLPVVLAASNLYGVPYKWADMSVVEDGGTLRYRSSRRAAPAVGHDIEIRPEGPCTSVSELDHWLSGRWRAYTKVAGGLATVPVDHEPWPLWSAEVVRLEQSLLAAAGLPEPDGPPLVRYSPGVHADLGPPRWVRRW